MDHLMLKANQRIILFSLLSTENGSSYVKSKSMNYLI